jgi:hypothetical protein
MSQSSIPRTQTPRPTLCGAGLLVHKSSLKGGYSVFLPATLGGVLLLDWRPYALLPAKVFLPPVPGSESKNGWLEHDYASQESSILAWSPAVPQITGNVLTDEGKARRNCAAIHSDLEVVISFVDRGLERLSRSVKMVDHHGDGGPSNGETKDGGKCGGARACYVNLDYGWALLDLNDVGSDTDLEALLVNRIWHPGRDEDEDEDADADTDANTKGPAIISTKSLPEDGPEEPHLDSDLDSEEEDGDEGSLPRLSTCTARKGPQNTTVHEGYLCLSFAGTGDGTLRHYQNVLLLEYDYDGMSDHGSWVVDPRTGEWWGMLVAERGGCCYAVPAEAIVENIKSAMGVREVTLPVPLPKPKPNPQTQAPRWHAQPLWDDTMAHYSVRPRARAYAPRAVNGTSRV